MRSVQKTRVKIFRLSFSTGGSSRKSRVFRLDPPVGILSRKKLSRKSESKEPFFDCVRRPDLGFSRKRPFSTDKSDCIRNGLMSSCYFYIYIFCPREFLEATAVIHNASQVSFNLYQVPIMCVCFLIIPSIVFARFLSPSPFSDVTQIRGH